jgi:hypothetical protein
MPLMSEPSEQTQEILALFRWFRGGTLSAFSQVEFSLCRLLSRLRERPEFSPGLEVLPFKAPDRSKKFRKIFLDCDALHSHAERAVEICDTFDLIIEPRNFLAHGFARIDMPTRVVQMRRFQPVSGNTWNESQWDIPFDKMQPWGHQIDALAQAAVGLCIEVSSELDLDF